MKLALICLCAIALNRFLGEPRRWNPWQGFDWLARRMDDLCYGPAQLDARWRRLLGAMALFLLIAPAALAVWSLSAIPFLGVAVDVGLLYLALGISGLAKRVGAVEQALSGGHLDEARAGLARMVGRDTEDMDEGEVSLAAVEAVLKEGCKAIFAVLFWYLAAGAPGVVIYRLAYALDTRWGHPTPRYLHFGWAAARLDDLLNWIPARLTALSYALLGNREAAWRCWQRQAAQWRSPNAGPVLAAGAGALGLQLGGAVRYYGRVVPRPALGEGLIPRAEDIGRAAVLVSRALGLWAALLVVGGWLLG